MEEGLVSALKVWLGGLSPPERKFLAPPLGEAREVWFQTSISCLQMNLEVYLHKVYYGTRPIKPVFGSKITFFARCSLLKMVPVDRKLNFASDTIISKVNTRRRTNLDKV
jgi:hypothetical protein